MRAVLLYMGLLLAGVGAWAAEPPVVSAPDALNFKGTCMVPLRPMAELLGAELTVDDIGITMRKGDHAIFFAKDALMAVANGDIVPLPLPIFARVGVTYVPLRALVAALGGTLASDGKTITVQCTNTTLRLPVKVQTGTPTAYHDDDTELYFVNIDGTGLKRLTYNDAYDSLPNVAPDGRAWVNWRDNAIVLRTWTDPHGVAIYPTGEEDPGYWSSPTFSPDGQEILFDYAGAIYLMRRDGSARRKLADGGDPAFSPDGKTIAFNSGVSDQSAEVPWQIATINADGSGLRQVGSGFALRWANDGRACYACTIDDNDLKTLSRFDVHADGTWGAATPLVTVPAIENIFLACDGVHMLYTKDDGILYLADADGAHAQPLTTEAWDSAPFTSPDGKRVAFYRDNALYCLTLGETKPVKVADYEGNTDKLGPAIFTPDSRSIIFIDCPESTWHGGR